MQGGWGGRGEEEGDGGGVRASGCGTSHSEEDIGTWRRWEEEMTSTVKGNKTDK